MPSIPILRKNNLKNIIIQSSKDIELNENTTKKKKVLISEINRNLIISSNATKNLFINEKMITIQTTVEYYTNRFNIFKKIVIYAKNLFIILNYFVLNVIRIFFVVNVSKIITKNI